MSHPSERYIPGPAFTRCCDALSEGGYRWSEMTDCKNGKSLSEIALPCGFLPPDSICGSIIKWPAVNSARLLVDIMANKEAADYRRIFSYLGKNLAELHSLTASEDLLQKRSVSRVEETEVYKNAFQYAAERDVSVPVFTFGSKKHLIHGRFSTAMILPDEKAMVMTSVDIGQGDPMFDISQILSEIWEFYCSFSKSSDWQREMGLTAKSFVNSYKRHSGYRLNIDALREMCRAKSATHVLILAFLRKDISIFHSHIARLQLGESFFDYLNEPHCN